MKKKNALISLVSTMALLCVGGGVALGANAEVSAEETSQQIMLGASILVANDKTGVDSNGIRFPVVVEDSVAEKITESKMYVLPADKWTGDKAPTADELKTNGTAFVTKGEDGEKGFVNKWVNYYEQNEGYGDGYEEAVVYIYNLPSTKYATDFYVCSWIKLNDDTEELSEVKARSMTYVAQKAVESGAYEMADLGNYINATYKVNKYLRTVYGSYELTGETTTVEGTVGELPTVQVDGYTYNEALTAQANPELYDGANLNFYYENNDYTFSQQEIGKDGNGVHTNLTYEKRAMTNVSPENLRGNTYYYKKTVNDGATWSKFEYDNKRLGSYLMLNLYFLNTWASEPGVNFKAWNSSGTEITNSILVKSYDDQGKYIPGELIDYATAGNWITTVLKMDADALGKTSTSMRLSFTHWTKNELYIGEYTYLTEDQFKQYYQQPYVAKEIISGVYEYPNSDGLNNSDNVVSLKDVTSYAEKSYVAITAKTSVAAPVKMYAADGTTKVDAYQIFNENGKVVTDISANTAYTYVFYMGSAITVGETAGRMFIDTPSNFTVKYGSAYTAKDMKAYNRLQYKLFEERGIEGITYKSPNQITRVGGLTVLGTKYDQNGLVGDTANQKDGTLYYPITNSLERKYHMFTIDGVSSFTKDQWVVVKVKGKDEAPWACFWDYENQSSGTGVDFWGFRGSFDEDRKPIDDTPTTGASYVPSEYKGKWVYLAYQIPYNVTVKTVKYNDNTEIKQGSFALGFGGKDGGNNTTKKGDLYVGGVYIMTDTAFYKFFNITKK